MREVECLGISRAGQTLLARLMETQIRHLPAGSVALLRGEFTKGTVASACLLSGRKLSPSSCLDIRYFSFSIYATGAFQPATSVQEIRRSESE